MTANYKEPTVELIRVSDLFIDMVDEEIHVGNHRVPHEFGYLGYQRDPYRRISWVNKQAAVYNPLQMQLLDVALRSDGRYAIIDGGGRWLLAQHVGLPALYCRVHKNLSHEQEAALFVALAKERRPISNVDTYLADLAAGDEDTVAINDAISPYKVGKGRTAGILEGVGILYDTYAAKGMNADLIKKTAYVVANTWGGRKDNRFTGFAIKGNQFGAVALVLDLFPKIEPKLRETMMRKDYTPAQVVEKADLRLKGTKARTSMWTVVMAEILAQRSGIKVQTELERIGNSSLAKALHAQAGLREIRTNRHRETAGETPKIAKVTKPVKTKAKAKAKAKTKAAKTEGATA